ncbi:MAG: hypothetical protein EBY29_08520 [Planctomycetes bacterium]|nr:hypothetical protein [Planctomycetota bacterium]
MQIEHKFIASILVACSAISNSVIAQTPPTARAPMTPATSAASSKAAPVQAPAPAPPATPELLTEDQDILFALLHTEVSIDFDETPAKDALNYIQQIVGVQMVARWLTEKNSIGMDPKELITVKLQRVCALDALETVLAELSTEHACTWQLRGGFLEVGTKDNLSRRGTRKIKLYPIKDLLYEVPYFDNAPNFNIDAAFNQGGGGGGSLFGNGGESPERATDAAKGKRLIELIKSLVEPEAWENDWATIDYTHESLVVRAPDYVHRALGGYSFLAPSRLEKQRGTGRYVSMTVPMTFSQLQGFSPASTSGSVGGGVGGGAGGGGPRP